MCTWSCASCLVSDVDYVTYVRRSPFSVRHSLPSERYFRFRSEIRHTLQRAVVLWTVPHPPRIANLNIDTALA